VGEADYRQVVDDLWLDQSFGRVRRNPVQIGLDLSEVAPGERMKMSIIGAEMLGSGGLAARPQ
jgi:hypothetical protein